MGYSLENKKIEKSKKWKTKKTKKLIFLKKWKSKKTQKALKLKEKCNFCKN